MRACAKINLALRVLGVRPDGYHELRTTFQSLALHDTLTCTVDSEDLRIECNDPACPTDATNLVWRAAELVWRAAGRDGKATGVRIRLAKRIPMQAGLGGGSSDAAAALRACARLWRVKGLDLDLVPLAAALGADVPFFLHGGTAIGAGRGDLIQPLDDGPSRWVVLVLPDFGVSTKDAFEWKRLRPERGAEPPSESERGWGPASIGEGRDLLLAESINDLQSVVEARHPEIGRIVKALRRAGASVAAMSGSGSAVFGLFDSRPRAAAAVASLATRRRRALLTRTLDRATYGAFSRLVSA